MVLQDLSELYFEERRRESFAQNEAMDDVSLDIVSSTVHKFTQYSDIKAIGTLNFSRYSHCLLMIVID